MMQVHNEPDPVPSEVSDWDLSGAIKKSIGALVVSFLLGAAISAYVVYQIMKG